MIPIKTPKEIEIMRQAGKLLAGIMKKFVSHVRPSISTLELDQLAEKLIIKAGAKPAFKGYKNKKGRVYPATLCTSINDQVVHAIPSKEQIIRTGNIIGLDCGLLYQEYYADMALTVPIGNVSHQAKRLIKVAKKSLDIGIKKIKPGVHLGDISSAIQSYVEKNGFSVVRQLSGHGIGKKLHEEPTILNYGKEKTGPVLKPRMTLALEPMINAGGWRVKTLKNRWTIVTIDGSLSAHFEHTVLITKKGSKILTKL